jgi:hypothetical protein
MAACRTRLSSVHASGIGRQANRRIGRKSRSASCRWAITSPQRLTALGGAPARHLRERRCGPTRRPRIQGRR